MAETPRKEPVPATPAETPWRPVQTPNGGAQTPNGGAQTPKESHGTCSPTNFPLPRKFFRVDSDRTSYSQQIVPSHMEAADVDTESESQSSESPAMPPAAASPTPKRTPVARDNVADDSVRSPIRPYMSPITPGRTFEL